MVCFNFPSCFAPWILFGSSKPFQISSNHPRVWASFGAGINCKCATHLGCNKACPSGFLSEVGLD
uniref:Uncharacterized protein n=1 Tax=Arundo donax TaxID=35708 RepID=A0A0A9EQ64_ARUDO